MSSRTTTSSGPVDGTDRGRTRKPPAPERRTAGCCLARLAGGGWWACRLRGRGGGAPDRGGGRWPTCHGHRRRLHRSPVSASFRPTLSIPAQVHHGHMSPHLLVNRELFVSKTTFRVCLCLSPVSLFFLLGRTGPTTLLMAVLQSFQTAVWSWGAQRSGGKAYWLAGHVATPETYFSFVPPHSTKGIARLLTRATTLFSRVFTSLG